MSWSLNVAPVIALLIMAACGPAVPRFPEPPPRAGLVNDHANVLDAATERRIARRLATLRAEANVEFWVLTVRTTSWLPASQYAYNTITTWGLDSPPHPPDVLFLLVAVDDGEWFVGLSKSLQDDVPHDTGRDLGSRTLGCRGADGIEEFVAMMSDLLVTRRAAGARDPAQDR